VSDAHCHAPAPRIGLFWTYNWFLVQLNTGAGNESGTPPPGKKEAVRRVGISSRPFATLVDESKPGDLVLSSFDSSFAH
jgi:hypothetical protein